MDQTRLTEDEVEKARRATTSLTSEQAQKMLYAIRSAGYSKAAEIAAILREADNEAKTSKGLL